MATETLNMLTVPLSRVIKQIKLQLLSEDYTPIIVIGKSGIGKTESVGNLAKELKIGFTELRLSHYQESDLVGLPYIEDGKTKHAETDLLPNSLSKEQGILLLDEVTSCQKSMRSAVYQLLDSSRKLGQYKLPPRWLIVCCGNGPDDGGDFRGIEPALMSRGRCLRVEENLKDWKEWAIKNKVHPTVIAYLSFDPSNLHVMDLDRPNDMIACPRNWVKLSTQLINMEKISNGMIRDTDDLDFAACSCVGERCGPSFVSFYMYNKHLIDLNEVLSGKSDIRSLSDIIRISGKMEIMYITVQSLISIVSNLLKESKIESNFTDECVIQVVNVCNWLIDVAEHIGLDIAIMAFQDLGENVREFKEIIMRQDFDEKCPKLLEFLIDNYIVFK